MTTEHRYRSESEAHTARRTLIRRGASVADTVLWRGDWLTDCGNDCRGPEGHREGCPIHCYCYDD